MIKSMTAFAVTDTPISSGTLHWEIKAVNHRYLEINFKLPEVFYNLEKSLKGIIEKTVIRGRIDCLLHYVENTADIQQEIIKTNLPFIQQIIALAEDIANLTKLPTNLNIMDLLIWSQTIQQQMKKNLTIDNQNLINSHIKNSFINTINKLDQARKQEGQQLKIVVAQRLDAMLYQIEQIKLTLPEIIHQQKIKLINKIAELELTVDKTRLEQEIVFLINKSDIAEEIDRIIIHINETKRLLTKGGVIGRHLDFLMQEINRETNTIASKAIETNISLSAIELKLLTEQIREQAQNIE